MFDQFLRALKDWLLAPVARAVGPRLSPNLISVVAFAVGMSAAAAIVARRDGLALALWIVNRVLDGFDGTQARVHDAQSDFGGYLDIVLDFAVYSAVPIAIVATDARPGLLFAGVVLFATFFVNAASWMYLAAILERRHAGAAAHGELTTITMPPGIVAGAETVIFYALFIALPAWRVGLFWTMGALVSVNIVQRLWWAWRRL
jgi:phosphatidylglycerophosphate synthase